MNRLFGSLLSLTLCAGLCLSVSSVHAQAVQPAATKDGAAAGADASSKPAKPAVLGVGSDAPPLKVGQWLKGKEIKSLEKGQIYVVEFWATWCGPCIKGIPHITELAKKYKDKVTVIGVSIWESEEDRVEVTKAFVDKMGDKMVYSVAIDDSHGNEGTMVKTWMIAAEQLGIPAAFIVGAEGKILWIGHPGQMDKPLAQIVEGNFDAAAAAKNAQSARDKAAKAELEQAEFMKALEPLQAAVTAEDHAKTITIVDDLSAKYPLKADGLSVLKYRAQIQTDEVAAQALAEKLSKGFLKDDPQGLNELAWLILDTKSVKNPNYTLAHTIATRAAELTKNKDGMIIDTLALATFKKGDVAKAVELQTKAVELSKDFPEEIVTEMETRLAEYKKAAK